MMLVQALRFVLELTALAVVAVWGATAELPVVAGVALGVGAPLAVAAFAVLVVVQAVVVHARHDVEATRADALGGGPLA